jgi:hypothetical protein
MRKSNPPFFSLQGLSLLSRYEMSFSFSSMLIKIDSASDADKSFDSSNCFFRRSFFFLERDIESAELVFL